MGWWSEQRNDYRSQLVELVTTKCSVKGSTKRGVIAQTRAAFPSNCGAFTHFPYGDARCGSKPAQWRCRIFFTKERCAMIFQKSQPVEAGHECLSSASTGPLKNMDA
jgi:hypothetical protein